MGVVRNGELLLNSMLMAISRKFVVFEFTTIVAADVCGMPLELIKELLIILVKLFKNFEFVAHAIDRHVACKVVDENEIVVVTVLARRSDWTNDVSDDEFTRTSALWKGNLWRSSMTGFAGETSMAGIGRLVDPEIFIPVTASELANCLSAASLRWLKRRCHS